MNLLLRTSFFRRFDNLSIIVEATAPCFSNYWPACILDFNKRLTAAVLLSTHLQIVSESEQLPTQTMVHYSSWILPNVLATQSAIIKIWIRAPFPFIHCFHKNIQDCNLYTYCNTDCNLSMFFNSQIGIWTLPFYCNPNLLLPVPDTRPFFSL